MSAANLERARALHRDGKVTQAVALYRAALKTNPRNFEALYRLGLALAQKGKYRDAAKWVGKALDVRPDFAQGHFDFGSLLLKLRRFEPAAAALGRAVALAPDHAEAHHNLGVALSELGRLDEALAAFDCAIDLRPDLVSLFYNRANTLRKMQRFEHAAADYRRVLSISPEHVPALNNLGNCLGDLGHDREAHEVFRRAVALKPDYAHAWFNLADLQRRQGLWQEARESLERVIALDPDYPFARGALVNVAMHCCDWEAAEMHAARVIRDVRAGKPVCAPFIFLGISGSPADQRTCAETWVRYKCPPVAPAVWRGERYRHDRIRLAYVSADFHHHPLAFLMSGLFERHDRSRFELTAIALDPDEDTPIRRRLRAAFDNFIEVGSLGDAAIARQIRELEIDILVDRKGYTMDSRTEILAMRPAPIQVSYLAYPGTMGAPYIDYVIADRIVIPDGDEKHYTEQVVRLPDTYQANDSQRPVSPARPTRSDVGLPERSFVFCCFNNSYKITRPVFDLWMSMMRDIPDSVLWLYASNPPAVHALKDAAAERGVDRSRLVFGEKRDNPAHLARLSLADLSLDTLPYGAHTTASDSLYVGVPIVTCPGNTFAGGVTASLLHAVGLPELVAPDYGTYRQIALDLARDPAALARLRARLAENVKTEPLFDTALFCRNIEAAYSRIWERHQAGLPPRGFDVARAGAVDGAAGT